MQFVQDSLQACQDGAIQFNREGSFQSRFMLCLRQQPLQLYQLYLKVQFPVRCKYIRTVGTRKGDSSHCHKSDDGFVQVRILRTNQKRSLFVGIFLFLDV